MNRKEFIIYVFGLACALTCIIRMLWLSILIYLYGNGMLIEPRWYIIIPEIILLILGIPSICYITWKVFK